jgi:hypothetical protein
LGLLRSPNGLEHGPLLESHGTHGIEDEWVIGRELFRGAGIVGCSIEPALVRVDERTQRVGRPMVRFLADETVQLLQGLGLLTVGQVFQHLLYRIGLHSCSAPVGKPRRSARIICRSPA